MKKTCRAVAVLMIPLALGACGGKRQEKPKKELTQQQRDSILAETPLPGAKVVGRAIAVSDSAAARSKRLDEGAE